jgi:hypothetical protein
MARWIGGTVSGRDQPPAAEITGPPQPNEPGVAGPAAPAAGIAILPSGRFAIRFTATQPRGTLTLTLTDDPRVLVRALNGSATFTTAGDHLTIDNRESSADYAIEIPRLAPHIDVYVGARRVVTVAGARVSTTPGVDHREQGEIRIPLGPAR